MAYQRRIEQVRGVVGVAYADWFGAKYQNESNAFPVFAVDPMRYLDMYPEFTIAREQRDAFAKTRTGAVVGKRLADRFGWHVGQKLPISSEIHTKTDGSLTWEFDLVGIIDADAPAVRGNTDMVLINVAYFDEARQSGKGKTGWYIVRIADSTQARGISSSIDTLFMNSPDETKTQPEKEFAIGFAKQIGDIGALVTRILIAVFFTILILTGNTMAQSIRERIPELAILKTLGFSDGKLTALLLAEAILLLILGGSLGMGAAVAAMPRQGRGGATGSSCGAPARTRSCRAGSTATRPLSWPPCPASPATRPVGRRPRPSWWSWWTCPARARGTPTTCRSAGSSAPRSRSATRRACSRAGASSRASAR